jgi:hypothetical protein
MLNKVSEIEAAADARTPFGAGACLPSVAVQTAQMHLRAAAFPRPRAFWAADVLGQRHTASGRGMALAQQPNPSKQNYPYPTRIAAASGGTLGPHPARDPV